MPQQLIDTLILSMGRRCETCLAVRGDYNPLLKTGCFLLDPHHRDVSAFNGDRFNSCQVIYSQFGLAIHQNDHQARRIFVEWAQNEIAVVPDFHKRILFSDESHFWLNGYVNKQNCRIWSEANPQVYVETPLHPEKLTVWCALWAGGILLQKR
ncbi:putative DD41D transposase [Trichonephila clavipes]|nr:putative DD41D transposase [Trichonephila clavipes]